MLEVGSDVAKARQICACDNTICSRRMFTVRITTNNSDDDDNDEDDTKAIMTMSFIVPNLDQINTWDIIMNEDVPDTKFFFFFWQRNECKRSNENKLSEFRVYTCLFALAMGRHNGIYAFDGMTNGLNSSILMLWECVCLRVFYRLSNTIRIFINARSSDTFDRIDSDWDLNSAFAHCIILYSD